MTDTPSSDAPRDAQKSTQPHPDDLDPALTSSAEVVEAVTPEAPRTPRDIAIKTVQILASFSVVAFLIGYVVPTMNSTSWPEIIDLFAQVGWLEFGKLFAIMIFGLYCYTYTLSASLPGLTHTQALIVNLAGSGVSNAIPGGGATGTAATYAIFRSWGFSHKNIGTSIIITSIFNMLLRLLLPLAAIVWLLATASTMPKEILLAAGAAAVLGTLIAGTLVAILLSEKAAHRIGHALNSVITPIMRLLKREHTADVEAIAVDMRGRILSIVASGWPRIIFGILAFLLLHFWMFRECAEVVGVHLSWAEIFCCYAVSRMMTVIAITPGGIGLTEAGPAVVFVALGVAGAPAAAALFLYAIFSHILEIPLGVLAGGAWAATRKRFYHKQEEDPDAQGPEKLPAFH